MDPADGDALDDDFKLLLDVALAEQTTDTRRGSAARSPARPDRSAPPTAPGAPAPRPPRPGGPDDGIEEPPSVPLLPAMADRIERVQGAVAALATRLDGLVATVNSLRSTLTDELAEHAAAMATLVQGHQGVGDESRRASERVAADLRRTGVNIEQANERLATRVGDLIERFEEIEQAAGSLAAAGRASSAGSAAPDAALLADLVHDVGGDLLGPVRDEIAQLKRRLAVRAKAPMTLDDDGIDQLAAAVAARLGDRALINLTQGQLSVLADAVADRLTETFEVLPDDPEPASGRKRRKR